MALFKKDPPKACPKCGRSDGWRIQEDVGQSIEFGDRFSETLRPGGYKGNMFTEMRIQNRRRNVVRYHCDHCGFEKSF